MGAYSPRYQKSRFAEYFSIKLATIERADYNGRYSPENCDWIPIWEQGWNKRNNRNITFQDRTQCIGKWADELGVPYISLYNKLRKHNWDMNEALRTKLRKSSIS